MRAMLLAAVLGLAAVGCKRESASTRGDKPTKTGADASPPVRYAGEYDGGNPVAADGKYKGRRVTFPRVEVMHIERASDGRAFVAPLSVLLQGPAVPAGTGGMGGHAAPRVPEPCYFFYLRTAADAARLKRGDVVDITGVCRGYKRDALWRGNVPGMNWHVDVEDCALATK